MYKNQSNQNITFLMLSLADNSPVTGITPTIYITKDNGSQTASAGTVSEKGNGVYNYSPTQTETNADCISFLFQGTGAKSINKNIYTEDTSVIRSANLTQIDGLSTSGNNATLNLKQLNIVNSNGNAINAESSSTTAIRIYTTVGNAINATGGTDSHCILITSNGTGSGLRIIPNGTGSGLNINGGATSGSAIVTSTTNGSGMIITGSGVNSGIYVTSTGTGHAIHLAPQGSSGDGIRIAGIGSGVGARITGGPTSNAINIVGGSTSGAGISISATSGNGIRIQSGGSGSAISLSAGDTGTGIIVAAGSISGDAVSFTTTNGNGINISTNGSNKFDINADTISTGIKSEIFSSVYEDIAIFNEVNQTSSTTSFSGTSDLSEDDDFYKYGVIVFKTGSIKGVARRISSYTGSTRTIIVDKPFPEQPSIGDEFIIIGLIL